jgi:hypothetical protein
MKSIRVSAVIGLTIGVGPAITAHLMPQIGMLDQLGTVILGLIIGMQAASGGAPRQSGGGHAVVSPETFNSVSPFGTRPRRHWRGFSIPRSDRPLALP